jgi:hypothetical protein
MPASVASLMAGTAFRSATAAAINGVESEGSDVGVCMGTGVVCWVESKNGRGDSIYLRKDFPEEFFLNCFEYSRAELRSSFVFLTLQNKACLSFVGKYLLYKRWQRHA